MSQMENRHCGKRGCRNSTREDKPFCPTHVLEHPYVQQIALAIKAREDEIARIELGGTPDLTSSIVSETLVLLHETGGATVERLARERGISHHVSMSIIEAMNTAGMVTLRKTKRGAVIAQIAQRATPPGRSR